MASPEVHFHDFSQAYNTWIQEAVRFWTMRTLHTSTQAEVETQRARDQEAINGLRAVLQAYESDYLQVPQGREEHRL